MSIDKNMVEYPEDWSLTINPKRSLLKLNLKEVWQYKDLIVLFVRRDFISKYNQTILGPIWFIVQPLLTTLIFTVVFSKIANISTEGAPPILFYMCGIVAWNYFAGCINATSNTFVSNANIFGKVYFPRLTVPISIVISNLIQFGIQFLLLVGFYVWFLFHGYNIRPNILLLYIPVLVVLMAILGLGFGIIISSLTTRYRDLVHLVGFGVTLWMYATPVIYPLSALPEKYRFIILANPLSPIIETFRYAIVGSGSFNFNFLLYSGSVTLGIILIGILLFNKVEQTFMDTV